MDAARALCSSYSRFYLLLILFHWQDWLTDMEITYTQGPMNLNWKQIMQTINGDERFYMNTEEDEVTEKEAGWEFLRLYGRGEDDDEEEEDDDSEFSEAEAEEEEEQLVCGRVA